jgi:hypothetical protein
MFHWDASIKNLACMVKILQVFCVTNLISTEEKIEGNSNGAKLIIFIKYLKHLVLRNDKFYALV